MSSWPPPCYQRATAYLTDPAERLMVFDHIDAPSAGTQVPAGGIEPGEAPIDAVVRELFEESGIGNAVVVRKLGEAWHQIAPGQVPAGFEEQVHHAFHLRLPAPPSIETWEWEERSGGEIVQHRYTFRWVTLADAAQLLWPSQAMWLASLRSSLARG